MRNQLLLWTYNGPIPLNGAKELMAYRGGSIFFLLLLSPQTVIHLCGFAIFIDSYDWCK